MDALPLELLWKIFMINTERQIPYKATALYIDDEPDSRLDTARSCSQVCRTWRTLLLQSPSVWGRLLYIQSFERTADEWRKAVISRVGDAPLWIIGIVSDSTRPFILSVLQKKWHSVQVLVMRDKDLPDGKLSSAWSFLEREAPTLEVFNVWTNSLRLDAQHIPPLSPLFRNAAPRLVSFVMSEPFHLTLPIPWLANLHTITFNRKLQSVSTILSALKSTPRLKHLYILGDSTPRTIYTEDGDVDKLHLPLLETLAIRDRSPKQKDLILLLESITLAPRQNTLRTLDLPPVVDQRLHCLITKWIHAYMDSSPPRHLVLTDCNEESDILEIEMRTSQHREAEGMVAGLALDGNFPLAIKNIAQSPRFHAIETLDVLLGPARWPLRPLYEAIRSVTHLTAIGSGIGALFHDMQQFSLFPHLRTIYLPNHLPGTNSKSLMNFLEYRASVGSPVSVLELTQASVEFVSGVHKERLARIPGLTVMFKEDC
ncbi:hypothetical protein D9613_011858 [Agrocybe pediades]|uniref:F-box domain-containing protein n=1 Tax=Agrocybe pediades TaxID=84607 RepID=A0A8H4VLZ5_9AGAR|nr:hypothetical protein D9613_011858 [Agrocybe pediades]